MCRTKAEGGRRCPGSGSGGGGSARGAGSASSSDRPDDVTQIVWGDGDGSYDAQAAPQIPRGAQLGLQNWENRDGYRVNITRYEHKGRKYEILHRYGPAEPDKEAEDVSSIAGYAKWASELTPVDKWMEERADKGPWPGPPPGKGDPQTKGLDADMGTKRNPWPKPPWDMTSNQRHDHDYDDVASGVNIWPDKVQAAGGWVRDKLAGRT